MALRNHGFARLLHRIWCCSHDGRSWIRPAKVIEANKCRGVLKLSNHLAVTDSKQNQTGLFKTSKKGKFDWPAPSITWPGEFDTSMHWVKRTQPAVATPVRRKQYPYSSLIIIRSFSCCIFLAFYSYDLHRRLDNGTEDSATVRSSSQLLTATLVQRTTTTISTSRFPTHKYT